MTPGTATTRSLFEHLSDIASQVGAARNVFLCLDFDGTLAPIVLNPRAASMSTEMRGQLLRLARRKRFQLAIISGRSLADLEWRVGLDGLTCAGNHGLEIRGPKLSFIEPVARTRMPALQSLCRALEVRINRIHGTLLENKGLTASVHYRGAAESDRSEIRRVVDETVAPAAELFCTTQGLDVIEIRPRVNWNKGTAARLILSSSADPYALPVYLGDDATDEDAFSELADGITVKIGRFTATAAHYQLEYQEEVGEFLTWLAVLDDTLSPFAAGSVK